MLSLLIIGIVIFFSIHLVPITLLKKILINQLGENKYKALFSLIAIVGLLIIIYGLLVQIFISYGILYPIAKQ